MIGAGVAGGTGRTGGRGRGVRTGNRIGGRSKPSGSTSGGGISIGSPPSALLGEAGRGRFEKRIWLALRVIAMPTDSMVDGTLSRVNRDAPAMDAPIAADLLAETARYRSLPLPPATRILRRVWQMRSPQAVRISRTCPFGSSK
jgi:hypothetical protein